VTLWVVAFVPLSPFLVATLGRHLVICWHSLLHAEKWGKVWKNRADARKKFAPHHLVSILSAKLSHSPQREIFNVSPATSWQQLQRGKRPEKGENRVEEMGMGKSGEETYGAMVFLCTLSPLSRMHFTPHLTYIRGNDNQRWKRLRLVFPFFRPPLSPLKPPSNCRAKSLIVAQFSSYCICRLARTSHFFLPFALLKIAKESIYSFICPTICTVEFIAQFSEQKSVNKNIFIEGLTVNSRSLHFVYKNKIYCFKLLFTWKKFFSFYLLKFALLFMTNTFYWNIFLIP